MKKKQGKKHNAGGTGSQKKGRRKTQQTKKIKVINTISIVKINNKKKRKI